jgi:hypothetical protein
MTGDQKISHCSHLQRDNSAHSSHLRVGRILLAVENEVKIIFDHGMPSMSG